MDTNEKLLKENQGLRATVNTYREQNRLLRRLIESCICATLERFKVKQEFLKNRRYRAKSELERNFYEQYLSNNNQTIQELEKIMTVYNTIFK